MLRPESATNTHALSQSYSCRCWGPWTSKYAPPAQRYPFTPPIRVSVTPVRLYLARALATARSRAGRRLQLYMQLTCEEGVVEPSAGAVCHDRDDGSPLLDAGMSRVDDRRPPPSIAAVPPPLLPLFCLPSSNRRQTPPARRSGRDGNPACKLAAAAPATAAVPLVEGARVDLSGHGPQG